MRWIPFTTLSNYWGFFSFTDYMSDPVIEQTKVELYALAS